MGTCPHCKKFTLLGDIYAQTWNIHMANGRVLHIGHTCHLDAIRYANDVFPGVEIVKLVRANVLCEPVAGPEALTLTGYMVLACHNQT